jgi:hypothetical protein
MDKTFRCKNRECGTGIDGQERRKEHLLRPERMVWDMRDDDRVFGSEQAHQQGQEFKPAGAMGRGQQQAVLWSVNTSRAYHQPDPNRNFKLRLNVGDTDLRFFAGSQNRSRDPSKDLKISG